LSRKTGYGRKAVADVGEKRVDKGPQTWREMMKFKEIHSEEVKRRHHKRINSESTNSSFKWKHGEFLPSRKWKGQKRRGRRG
jgi:hypothetical protein